MDRRAFISGVTVSLLAAPLAAGAQQAGRMYRVGWIGIAPSPTNDADHAAVIR